MKKEKVERNILISRFFISVQYSRPGSIGGRININQWNGIEDSEIDPFKYTNLLLTKMQK